MGCFLNVETGLRSSGIPKYITILANQKADSLKLARDVEASNQRLWDPLENLARVIRRELLGQFVLRSLVDARGLIAGRENLHGHNLPSKSYRWGRTCESFSGIFQS